MVNCKHSLIVLLALGSFSGVLAFYLLCCRFSVYINSWCFFCVGSFEFIIMLASFSVFELKLYMKLASPGFFFCTTNYKWFSGVSVCTWLGACLCRPRHLLDNSCRHCIIFSLLHRLYCVQHSVWLFSGSQQFFLFVSIVSLSGFIFHSYLILSLPLTDYPVRSAHIRIYYRVFILCVHTCSIVACYFIIIFRLCSDCCGFFFYCPQIVSFYIFTFIFSWRNLWWNLPTDEEKG